MNKGLLLTVLTGASVLLTGCSNTTPPLSMPAPVQMAEQSGQPEQPAVQPVLVEELQKIAAGTVDAGGLAVVGISKSKSLELALDKAKINGRIELARMLDARLEVLEKTFSAETGIPYDSLLLSGFNNATKIIKQQIAGSVAQRLKYETVGEISAAYAVMVLDPKVIDDQLAKEKELYARLQKTRAFAALTQEIKTYEAFKTAQGM
jgi:PBP1b-binding outer membrane lipoprotein LpoB